MGVDIHWVFQAYKNNQWVDIPSQYDGTRDYYLYSWLRTGGRQAITKPRGFPSDFLLDADGCRHPYKDYAPDDRNLYKFMGEWGYSWLSGIEILSTPIPVENMKIWVPIDVYNEWDKCSNPKHWFELQSNWQQHEDSEHYATPENITDDTWWVIIDWAYDFTEDFEYFVGEVRRLLSIHGNIRFVFGFG